jgi:hypothetical protein
MIKKMVEMGERNEPDLDIKLHPRSKRDGQP